MNVNDRHNRIPLFGVSLCSKCWEVFGLKKEWVRERETHKGEGEYLSERPMKIVSLPSPITWQPLHDLAKILTKTIDLAQTKHAKALYIYTLALNVSVIKISEVI